MSGKPIRNILITIFVIVWTLVFHYESTRHFYLEPLLGKPLPKVKLLFPPAGWIMFFNVDDQFGYAEVYGMRGGKAFLIVPHKILLTRAIGYDNIQRNVLSTILANSLKGDFCQFLKRKFPEFDNFYITAVDYPSIVKMPFEKYQALMYECSER